MEKTSLWVSYWRSII